MYNKCYRAVAVEEGLPCWLSDEQCARGRAEGGVLCRHELRLRQAMLLRSVKIVLIVPDQKRVLNIANQAAAKNNVGDYVEVTGELQPGPTALRIASLKMLTEGRAMCDRPQHSSK